VSARAKHWLILIAALAGVAVTLSLGRWQLSRAGQKEAVLAAIQAESLKPSIGNAVLSQALPLHRKARLRGEWVASRTVYLDNRQMNGRPGFYVVTPLQLEGSRHAILVQRGWLPRNFENRNDVATVPSANGMVEIEGRIALPPSKLMDLGGTETGRIRQNLDMPAYALETGLQLLPVSLVQTVPARDAPADNLLREWPKPDLGIAKNYGYAVQWFLLASLIAALFVWFRIYKPHARQLI
jgi:surfeit locus 1 family protein